MTIYTYKQGSNQYVKTRKTNDINAAIAIALALPIVIAMLVKVPDNKTTMFLKSIEFKTSPSLVVAAEPVIPGIKPAEEPPATLENIVAYITKVFEPEGKAVVVRAIRCFYSESGLRPDAVNGSNSNGTVDRGIAQINSIWNMKPEDAHNYRKNIDKAYEIYKRSNSFNPWYGKDCH